MVQNPDTGYFYRRIQSFYGMNVALEQQMKGTTWGCDSENPTPGHRPHLRSSWAAAYLKCQHKAPGTQPHAPGGEGCCWSWVQLMSQQHCSQMVPFSLAETQDSPTAGIPMQQGRAEGKLQCLHNGFEVLHVNPSLLAHLNAYNACFLR